MTPLPPYLWQSSRTKPCKSQAGGLSNFSSRAHCCLQMGIPCGGGCGPGVDWLYKHIAWADMLTIHLSLFSYKPHLSQRVWFVRLYSPSPNALSLCWKNHRTLYYQDLWHKTVSDQELQKVLVQSTVQSRFCTYPNGFVMHYTLHYNYQLIALLTVTLVADKVEWQSRY